MADFLLTEFPFMTELERYDAFLRLYHSDGAQEKRVLTGLISSKDPLVALIVLQYLEDIPEKRALAGVLHMVERGNEVISRAAMAAYKRSHYPGKARQLKRLVLSRNPRARRFAVRTLCRAGFMEVLPLVVRELPDSEGEVRSEMIDGLRYLPDRRSVQVLTPMADSLDEPTRWQALQVLGQLQARVGGLPASFFLKRSGDPSDRVRRAALEGLHAYPTKRVAQMILAQALDDKESDEVRDRSLRALAGYPNVRWVRPLTAFAAATESASLRLAVEVALRSYPEEVRRDGLTPLLDDPDPALKRQAALLLADLSGKDPSVRARLLKLWDGADDRAAVDFVDVLRALGGSESAERLRGAMNRHRLVAYAAAGALARLRGHGAQTLAALRDESVSPTVHQAILSQWARRGPDDTLRPELEPLLIKWLKSPVINIRYLALQILAWFPLHGKLEALMDVLAAESDPEVVATVSKQILTGLGADPVPLAIGLASHPKRSSLMGHGVRLLTAQNWDPRLARPLLGILAAPPLSMRDSTPETYFLIGIHLYSLGSVTFQDLWEECGTDPRRRLLMRLLATFMADTRRKMPALPLDSLCAFIKDGDAELRGLVYSLLAAEDRPESTETLAVLLYREKDPDARARGAGLLRRVLKVPA